MHPAPTPRLMIIDDDPKLAAIVAEIARETFPDPRELLIESIITSEAAILAIRRASHAKHAALVVISDFHLPPSAVSGLDLLDEVRRRIPHAKRVLMTGHDPEEFDDLLAQAELDAFVSKPFTFDEMQAVLRRLVAAVAVVPATPMRVAFEGGEEERPVAEEVRP